MGKRIKSEKKGGGGKNRSSLKNIHPWARMRSRAKKMKHSTVIQIEKLGCRVYITSVIPQLTKE
jgi:hypothetical protein